jgi:hypothetical protein
MAKIVSLPEASNCHPCDELAELRAQREKIEARENELRRIIVTSPDLRVGEEHVATVAQCSRDTINLQKLKRDFGLKVLKPYLRSNTFPMVYLRKVRAPLRRGATDADQTNTDEVTP